VIDAVIFSRSLEPNIKGSNWSADVDSIKGARRGRIDRRTVDGELILGTSDQSFKVAIIKVRELLLTSTEAALSRVKEIIVTVTAKDSEEAMRAAAENLARFRRSRIRMPRIIEGKQLDADDASLREYQRVAAHRTRCRKKLRGGN
jgi:hypothetical protein